jgi:NAD+ synthase
MMRWLVGDEKMSYPQITVPNPDFPKMTDEVTRFIHDVVEEADARGVVIGLSGGVDSSLVATLCVHSLGRTRVLGILLPTNFTPPQDVKDAMDLAAWLGIRTQTVMVHPLYDAFAQAVDCDPLAPTQKGFFANVLARIRMTLLYYYANRHHYLVAGTGDRSEDLIGYFTKYGDGGVDFLPISHLYKTQVRAFATYLNVPDRIAYKPSSPQLYPGHQATDDIPLDYDQLDRVLVGLYDEHLSPDEVSRYTRVPIDIVKETQRRYTTSQHKRAYPPMLRDW